MLQSSRDSYLILPNYTWTNHTPCALAPNRVPNNYMTGVPVPTNGDIEMLRNVSPP
jgi:hypothetical protein